LTARLPWEAAAAGKHVVLEKPVCLNLSEEDRMVERCRGAEMNFVYIKILLLPSSRKPINLGNAG